MIFQNIFNYFQKNPNKYYKVFDNSHDPQNIDKMIKISEELLKFFIEKYAERKDQHL